MGLRGPAPTPYAILKLRGSKRAKGRNVPTPEGDCLPPAWLSGAAKSEWSTIYPMLNSIGMLTPLDSIALGLLAESIAAYLRLRNSRSKYAMAVAGKAWERVLKACREFGLTPSSRSVLSGKSGGKKEKPKLKEKFFKGVC